MEIQKFLYVLLTSSQNRCYFLKDSKRQNGQILFISRKLFQKGHFGLILPKPDDNPGVHCMCVRACVNKGRREYVRVTNASKCLCTISNSKALIKSMKRMLASYFFGSMFLFAWRIHADFGIGYAPNSSEPALTLNVYYDRDAQLCRKFFLGVPPTLKMLKKWSNKLPYIHHFDFFLHLDVPPNFFTKLVCRELKRLRTTGIDECTEKFMVTFSPVIRGFYVRVLQQWQKKE